MPSSNGHSPKTAILYARVSTQEQAMKGYSLAQQLAALRQHAAREGYEVVEEVSDPGQSGISFDRPGMDRVRALVNAGDVSVVLAQDRDRIAREPAYHYLLRREFEEHGTKICALDDRGDDSPEGELTNGIIDHISKFERAKTAERTRRGKLRKAKEGKIIANKCADYGFKYNATRDGYLVDEETMPVVKRIFRMIGVEGSSLRSVAATLNREGVKPSFAAWSKSGRWGTTVIRENIIGDDAYRPHTYEEVKALVEPHVSARLDPSKLYGIWWYNRTKWKTTQVSVAGQNGKEYKKRVKYIPRPREEWVAVPVPNSGIPREWVDSAREAIKNNRRPSSAGHRFWELSGGILRCGGCGYAMMTNSIPSNGKKRLNHYYRCPKRVQNRSACPQPRNYRADKTEPQVWDLVSSLMTDPEQLRVDLERMIELEREKPRIDPGREAKVWLEKLAEVDQQRARAQDMAIEGLLSYDELRVKLAAFDGTRKTAERELEALRGYKERVEELERDRDTILEHYASMAPEALNSLSSEERHRVYKMLRVRALVHVDGTLEVSGTLAGPIGVSNLKTAPSYKLFIAVGARSR